MKFLPEEHLSIMNLLIENGIHEDAVSFRKRHGQLHIELVGKKETFCYYRKTESILNSNLKFQDQTHYLLGQKKDSVVKDWKEVLTAIKEWL